MIQEFKESAGTEAENDIAKQKVGRETPLLPHFQASGFRYRPSSVIWIRKYHHVRTAGQHRSLLGQAIVPEC
jgi:hypothetical protein